MIKKLQEVKDEELKKNMSDFFDGIRKESDSFTAAIVIALNNDGSQYLRTTHSSGLEKALMIQFAQAWMTKWFNLEDAK